MFATHFAICAIAVAALTGSPLQAVAEPVTIEIGQAGMRHVVFSFERSSDGPSVTLRTEMTGVAGSRLTVRIDRSPVLAFDHIFSEGECRFPAGGASRCEVVLGPDHPAVRRLVTGFKRGVQAHVTIEDAGIMRMDQAVSLEGFTRRYGA